MCFQEKKILFFFFFLLFFPITTTGDKLCLFLTWERTVGEGHFCSLHGLKLLLAGRCLSCWESFPPTLFPQPNALTTMECKVLSYTIACRLLNTATGARSVYRATFWYLLWKGNASTAELGLCPPAPEVTPQHLFALQFLELVKERLCCQWTSVESGGCSLPASGAMRLVAKTETAFPDVP